jgi:hypothetical protein
MNKPQTESIPNSSGLVLNEFQAAAAMGLSVHTLRAYRFRGCGPVFLKFGKAVRYLRQDLDDFLSACRVVNDAR